MYPTFVTAGPLKLRVLLAFLVICMHAKQQQQQREGKKSTFPVGALLDVAGQSFSFRFHPL